MIGYLILSNNNESLTGLPNKRSYGMYKHAGTGNPEHNFPDKLNPTPEHDASLSQCVTNVDNTDVLSVSIDGKNVPTPDRMKTDFFNITVGEDFTTGPLGGIKGGKSRALADGYFLFLSPLTPGQHNLVFNVQDRVTDISQPITTRQGNYTLFVK